MVKRTTPSSGERTSRPLRRRRTSEGGFTLAAVIVLLSIVAIFAAYTVPRQWSTIMQRERERQTIFVMKQYAWAIKNFQAKHNNTFPTSLDQIHEARQPRLIRGLGKGWACPITGENDWILVPPTAATQPGTAPPGGGQPPAGAPPGSGSATFNPAASPPDYANGPIAGVRPRKTGQSLLTLNGATSYEQWAYTVFDLDREIAARNQGRSIVYK